MSVITVKNAIITALEAMQSLKSVSGFPTSNSNGYYPHATVTLRGGNGKFITNRHNLRNRLYDIAIYQELSKQGQGVENSERIVTEIIDELENHFDMNTTLSGACKYATPVSFTVDNTDRELDTRTLNIIIEATEVVAADN